MTSIRSGKCSVFIGEDEFTACLRIGELIALQEKRGCGPFVIATRLASGEYFVEDIIETIRFGLMGGEQLDHREIKRLLDTYIITGHVHEYAEIAQVVVLSALMGAEDEPVPYEEEEEPEPGN